ncbi:putative nucleic acid-binding Zn-ribbon protein [Cytobacillus horneckiae]
MNINFEDVPEKGGNEMTAIKEDAKTQLEYVNAACEDIECENANLQDEFAKLRAYKDELEEKLYESVTYSRGLEADLELEKKKSKSYVDRMNKIDSENCALRRVIKIWA